MQDRENITYILTAELDAESFAWLDGLRRQHFPLERNLLSAHLTLFHRLSAGQVACLQDLAIPTQSIALNFDAPILLGFGVALRVVSPELEQIRREAQAVMAGEFSRQDSQRWKPHVTVQNKVPADIARKLHRDLSDGFLARHGFATGLLVWEYLGGPWKQVARMAFGRPAPKDM